MMTKEKMKREQSESRMTEESENGRDKTEEALTP
jgi:hypothetical protein